MKKFLRLTFPVIIAFFLVGVLLYMAGASRNAIAAPPQPARSNLVVDTLVDEIRNDGKCSLREAIYAANTNGFVQGCGTGDVLTDTITFDVAGMISLTSPLTVTAAGPLVIDGVGVITVSGGLVTRVWYADTDARLILSRLSVVDGGWCCAGAGLYNNSASVLISESTFSGNESSMGAAIYNDGNLSIQNSQLISNSADLFGGGAIYNSGWLTITQSVVANNDGGGIYNIGRLVSDYSVLSNNQALSDSPEVRGGAIYSYGSITLTHSIFLNNVSNLGGAIFSNGNLYVEDCSFTDNSASYIGIGGSIQAEGTSTIISSEFFSNTAENYGGAIANYGAMTIENNTFSGNTATYGGGIYSLEGSLSITGSSFDQNRADAHGGAIIGDHVTITDTTFTSNTSGAWGGAVSLGASTLTGSAFYSNTAQAYGGAIFGAGPLTITLATFSGNESAQNDGGAIFSASDPVTILDSTFSNNRSNYGDGGAIDGVNISISGSKIIDNYASSLAGGVFAITATITNSTISGNIAGDNGGGLYAAGDVSLISTTLEHNSAYAGGGIFSISGTLTLSDSFLSTNEAFIGGGLSADSMIITHTTFYSNSADAWGGAILNSGSNILSNNSFLNNTAEWGGAIYSYRPLTLTKSIFIGNLAALDTPSGGGAILYSDRLTIVDSTFSDNKAVNGNGGGISGTGDLSILRTTFNNNYANGSGGGVLCDTATITNSTFSGNIAAYGGGIYSEGDGEILYSTISSNTALLQGGGIYNNANTSLSNTIVANSLAGGDCFGTIVDGGYNLASDGTCNLDPANGSLPNTDPLLGPLQDNGGPTFTHALQWNSPAVDSGDNAACPSTDQRGVLRPQDGNGDGIAVCDIGAYERQFQPVPPADLTISGVVDGFVGQSYPFTATVEPSTTSLPLTFTWLATDQLPITHTSGLTDTASFSWDTPGSLLITVTASNTFGEVSATHAITITDVPISGLHACNDSPTLLGYPVTLCTTLDSGTNVSYAWAFGDGTAGVGASVMHTYPSAGLFTATVTATNSTNSMTASTLVTILAPNYSTYLPLATKSLGPLSPAAVPFSGLGSSVVFLFLGCLSIRKNYRALFVCNFRRLLHFLR